MLFYVILPNNKKNYKNAVKMKPIDSSEPPEIISSSATALN